MMRALVSLLFEKWPSKKKLEHGHTQETPAGESLRSASVRPSPRAWRNCWSRRPPPKKEIISKVPGESLHAWLAEQPDKGSIERIFCKYYCKN
jgi:hypothetical protein